MPSNSFYGLEFKKPCKTHTFPLSRQEPKSVKRRRGRRNTGPVTRDAEDKPALGTESWLGRTGRTFTLDTGMTAADLAST